MAQGVITNLGRCKLCKAHAGDIALPQIVQMGFGSGGVNADSEAKEITGAEIAMGKELLRKPIDSHSYLADAIATCRYSVKLLRNELVNEKISEIALFDAEGDMVAYKTFLPKGKDSDMEFVFDIDEIF